MKIKNKQIFLSRRKRNNKKKLLLIFILSLILFLIARNAILLFPKLANDYKVFIKFNQKLDKDISPLDILNKKNYYQQIINQLQKKLKQNSLSAYNHLLLGKAYFLKNKLETEEYIKKILNQKTIYYIRKGLALLKKDQYPEFHYILAEAYFNNGIDYYFEALKEFQIAKKMKYYNTNIEKKMAYIYLKKGELKTALKLYKHLLRKEKTPDNYFYLGLTYYNLKNLISAEEYFNYAIDAYKSHQNYKKTYLVYSYLYIGQIYFDKKTFDIAENYLNKSLSIYPKNKDTLLLLYKLYKTIGNNSKAKEIKKKLKELNK